MFLPIAQVRGAGQVGPVHLRPKTLREVAECVDSIGTFGRYLRDRRLEKAGTQIGSELPPTWQPD